MWPIITINKIEESKSADELKTWGIISLLFVSLIGGIFVLCIKDEESVTTNETQTTRSGYERTSDPCEKLLELKELLDQGIIDDATYQEKRKKYVENL